MLCSLRFSSRHNQPHAPRDRGNERPPVVVSRSPRASLVFRARQKVVALTWKAAGMAEATGDEATMARSSSASSFKVYTRTGDGGSSCLFNMERRDKDDTVFEALGEVDEVGVAVGIARTFVEEAWRGDGGFGARSGPSDANGEANLGETPSALDGLSLRAAFEPLEQRLAEIQSRLMDVGSAVATPLDKSSEKQKSRVRFADKHVDVVEAWIDEYDAHLPPLANFILPGGGRAAAFLHQARTAARRAERRVVPLVRDGDCDAVVTKYLNRLSDFLYTAARFAAAAFGATETTYCKARE